MTWQFYRAAAVKAQAVAAAAAAVLAPSSEQSNEEIPGVRKTPRTVRPADPATWIPFQVWARVLTRSL